MSTITTTKHRVEIGLLRIRFQMLAGSAEAILNEVALRCGWKSEPTARPEQMEFNL